MSDKTKFLDDFVSITERAVRLAPALPKGTILIKNTKKDCELCLKRACIEHIDTFKTEGPEFEVSLQFTQHRQRPDCFWINPSFIYMVNVFSNITIEALCSYMVMDSFDKKAKIPTLLVEIVKCNRMLPNYFLEICRPNIMNLLGLTEGQTIIDTSFVNDGNKFYTKYIQKCQVQFGTGDDSTELALDKYIEEYGSLKNQLCKMILAPKLFSKNLTTFKNKENKNQECKTIKTHFEVQTILLEVQTEKEIIDCDGNIIKICTPTKKKSPPSSSKSSFNKSESIDSKTVKAKERRETKSLIESSENETVSESEEELPKKKVERKPEKKVEKKVEKKSKKKVETSDEDSEEEEVIPKKKSSKPEKKKEFVISSDEDSEEEERRERKNKKSKKEKKRRRSSSSEDEKSIFVK